MHLLQLLFRAGPAILLLVFCLQFRTNKAQEDTRKVLSMEVQMPRKTAPNEEISVTVIVQTELRECMVLTGYSVHGCQLAGQASGDGQTALAMTMQPHDNVPGFKIQCSLLSRNPMEGPFNYVYTACLCDSNPRTFYWDFEVNKTMSIIALTHIIDKEDICPYKAVVPNGPKYFYIVKNITVS